MDIPVVRRRGLSTHLVVRAVNVAAPDIDPRDALRPHPLHKWRHVLLRPVRAALAAGAFGARRLGGEAGGIRVTRKVKEGLKEEGGGGRASNS